MEFPEEKILVAFKGAPCIISDNIRDFESIISSKISNIHLTCYLWNLGYKLIKYERS